jgi:phosphonate transport system substrate-binding protein
MSLLLRFLAAGCLAWALGAKAAEPEQLHFGLISVSSPQALRQTWGPLIEDLNRQTGLNVSLYFATDYDGIIDAIRKNKIQLGYVSQKPAIEAIDTANSAVFSQTVTKDGNRGYYSHLIVHRNSNIKNVDDLFKKSSQLTYGNGDVKSTSGYLVPELYLFAKHNLSSKNSFASMRHANHEANALAVANQQIDVATNNNIDLARFKVRFPDKHKDIRIIWQSPLIPNAPLIARKDISTEALRKIKRFFISYGRSDGREKKILEGLDLSEFIEASDEILNPVRVMDLYSQRNAIQNNPALSPLAKAKMQAEVDQKIKALE